MLTLFSLHKANLNMIMRLINISIEWPLYTDQKVNLVIAGQSIPPLTTAIQFSTSGGSKQHQCHYMDFESIRTHHVSIQFSAYLSIHGACRTFFHFIQHRPTNRPVIFFFFPTHNKWNHKQLINTETRKINYMIIYSWTRRPGPGHSHVPSI